MTIDDEEGESAQAAATPVEAAEPEPVSAPQVDKSTSSGPGNSQSTGAHNKALSTPAVRYLAKKEGIDINQVPGTGKNGRVTKGDLLNFMKGGSAAPAASSEPAKASHASSPVQIAPLYGITEKD